MAGVDCIKRVIEKSGGIFDKDSASKLLDEMENSGRLLNKGEFHFDDAMKEAKARKIYESRFDSLKSKKEALINSDAKAAIDYKMNKLIDKGASNFEAVKAVLGGWEKGFEGSKDSLDARVVAQHGEIGSILIKGIEQKGLLSFAKNPANHLDIMKEWNYLTTKNKTGIERPVVSDMVKQTAKTFHDVFEYMRAEKNKAGAYIGHLDGFAGSQYHDQGLITEAGEKRWTTDTAPKIDPALLKQRTGKDVGEFLKTMYKDLSAGKQYEAGAGNMADRTSQSRVIPFKDAESFLAYNKQYGAGTMIDGMLAAVNKGSREIEMLKMLGTNPKNMFEKITEGVSPGEKKTLENIYKNIDGSLHNPYNPTLDQMTTNVAAFELVTKIGGGLFSHVPDTVFRASEAMAQGDGIFKAYGEAFGSVMKFAKLLPGDIDKALAAHYGVGFESFFGSLFHDSSVREGLGSKSVRMMLKWNGEMPWTNSSKRSASAGTSARFGSYASKSMSELNKGEASLLKQYSITAKDWDIMRSSVAKSHGYDVIMPDQIAAISNEKLKGFVGDLPDRQLDKIRDQLEDKWRTFVVDRTRYAQLTPGANERAMLGQGTQAGTPLNSALRLLLQFKQYPVTAGTKVWGRARFGDEGKRDIPQIAHLIVGGILAGYASYSLKQLVQGKTPDSILNPEVALNSAVRGIGGGLIVDAVNSFIDVGSHGAGSVTDALVGPLGSDINKAGKILLDVKQGHKVSKDAIKFGEGLIPGNNLPYIKPLLDNLVVNDMIERSNPGFKNRMINNAKKYGTPYIIGGRQ